VLRVGGMSLFMLPAQTGQERGDSRPDAGGLALRYGRFELERLIDEVIKLGANRTRLKAKMFGGGRNILRGNRRGRQNHRLRAAVPSTTWPAAGGGEARR